ncbi:hypothetical protein PENTCL1PPCAC_12107, partial [Pristionchus entomophagus]
DAAQYSTSTREPIGLPSISTFTPLINSNNGFRDQESPRFAASHTTVTTAAGASSTDSKPFSASISFAPLNAKQQPQPTPKRDPPPHPTAGPAAIFHTEPVAKKKSPLKKSSPIPKNGPPPAKKIALTPQSPPKNGSNGGSGMPALEAALRSPGDVDVARRPAGGAMMAPGAPGGANLAQRGVHPAVAVSRSLEFTLEGLSPFNPNEECALMAGPTSNGNNGYGYAPSPSNGHRGYFGETPRDSPLTLAPLEPLTTTFSTHSPAPQNGSNSYFPDWSNPSLASPMTLPPLNTIFSGHSSIDQPHSSSQFSASPISAYSAASPSASLLSISVQQQHHQQQAAAHQAAARPHSRPGADYGHYSGPLSHQSSSSVLWEEPPPPPTPTTHAEGAAGGGGGPKSAPLWMGSRDGQQPSAAGAPPRRPSLRLPHKIVPDGKGLRPQDPAYEKVQQILSKAAESEAAARKAANERRGMEKMAMPVVRSGGNGVGGGNDMREGGDKSLIDEEERKKKKREAQNEARRKKRAEKVEKDRMDRTVAAETGQLLLPVRQVPMHPHHHHHPHLLLQHPGPRPMQQQMMQPLQPPMRKMTDSGDVNCSITASINAVVHLDSGVPPDPSRAASAALAARSRLGAAAAAGEDSFSELRAAMLAEERPLVIRKESTSTAPPSAAANSTIVRQLQHPPSHRPAPSSSSMQHLQQPHPMQRKLSNGVRKAREGLMKEYQRSLGSSVNPGTSSRFLEVVMATRAVEEAQKKAELELERMQLRCAQLAEMTKLQHDTLQMHLKKITNGEDTTGLATSAREIQQQQPGMVMREGFSLRTLALLDEEIRCRRAGVDPSSSSLLSRRVSIAAVLTPPMAPATALRLEMKRELKVETTTASTMTDQEKEQPHAARTRAHDQSTRPLERCYLAGAKELLAEGYAVRDGGSVVRPREGSLGGRGVSVQMVDVEGRVWNEAFPPRLSNGVQHSHHQRRLNEDGEVMGVDGERSSGRVLRSAHRQTGYH